MSLKKIVFKHFMPQLLQPNHKMIACKYKYCKKDYVQHTTRMSAHLAECKGCPETVKIVIKQIQDNTIKNVNKRKRKKANNNKKCDKSSSSSNNCIRDISNNSDVENNISIKSAPKDNEKIKNYFDKISQQEQAHCEELLAKAIVTSGASLHLIENEHWQKFPTTLRPTFVCPSRATLSTKLLDKVYKDTKENVENKINIAPSVAIQCDSFTNIRSEGITNVIVNTPEPVFFKTIETKTDSQTGDYLAEQISRIIEEIGLGKVLGVCTDNAAYCKKAWKIIENKYKNNIFCYGCAAHVLNLLVKDINNQHNANLVLKNGTTIVKEIKQSNILSSNFLEIQKSATTEERVTISLKLPAQTRWGSSLDCLKSLFANKYNLRSLAISKVSDKLNRLTKTVILDDEFWLKVKKLIEIVEPIVVFLKVVEEDNSKISFIPEIFVNLREHFNTISNHALSLLTVSESKNIKEALEMRSKMVLTKLHYAANILNPSYKGKNLKPDEFTSGSEVIVTIGKKFNILEENLLIEIIQYNSDSGIFASSYIKQSSNLVSAIEWWRGACNKSLLSKIAVSILGLPCTSAATGRSFSTYGWIHSSKRNRLTVVRASKITYISHNSKLLDCKRKQKNEKKGIEKEHSESEIDEHEICNTQGIVGIAENLYRIGDVDIDISSTFDTERDEINSNTFFQNSDNYEIDNIDHDPDLVDTNNPMENIFKLMKIGMNILKERYYKLYTKLVLDSV